MHIPEEWPPTKAPDMNQQSNALAHLDGMIEKAEYQLKRLRELRESILVGWELASRKGITEVEKRIKFQNTSGRLYYAHQRKRKITTWRSAHGQ